ncbi:BACON domain-containing protein [Streptomyces gobiensis]|uniref:BACON domain-containing protein n=1 Tax=Streptomyces gobiensis TaxID=2875706 RepID=UPI001E4496B1|nr:sigma-70 family RNA polymerase sigma factor [Streptomyces gobiensis]UGY92191.1 sigma-70 family RNA polymerase sigma factor [Streptomyces gobiensis]
MMSRREHPPHTTGADVARRGAMRADPVETWPPMHYDPHLDGLFTYCLSVMCEHEAATAALGEALALAERQRERAQRRGRRPADTALYRPWLYALTRWACLRRLAAHGQPERPKLSGAAATQRRRELAALAWPEAAGTTPEQREALELAVRHQLPVHEVAAILSMDSDATRLLLSSGACEVERTRAALAVVETGGCPAVARLAGDHEVLLGTALRRELVRHVDACANCRRTAERVMAGASWPGTVALGTSTLTVLEAPRAAVHAAMRAALRARVLPTPRLDRRGFPVELRDRGARRGRLRSRAVTTTVVATVVAAPVVALWAAYRAAPFTGEGRDVTSASATEPDEQQGLNGHPYENAGRADRTGDPTGDPAKNPRGRRGAKVSAEADGSSGSPDGDGSSDPATRYSHGGGTGAVGSPSGAPAQPGPGRLTVDAQPSGDVTQITLTASGGSPVHWSASTDASWLRLSHTSGTLQPGESTTITVTIDRAREPQGEWSARIQIAPANTVITLQGRGKDPDPGPSDPGSPSPSDPEPSDPSPSPSDPPEESSPSSSSSSSSSSPSS